jgi:ATP-dependent DNA helicase RecQ
MRSDDEPGVNAAIQALVDSELAARQGQMAWALRPDGEEQIDTAGLEAHRDHAVAKLDAMQHYADSRTCLRARILDYFGDQGHAPACGNCGPCLAPPVTAATALDDATERLFHALRAVRRRFAEEENVPPFVIFNDATLREMASRRPRNRSEMLQVSGVGVVKFEKYGEAFLAVTKASAAESAPTGSRPATPPSSLLPPPSRKPVRTRTGRLITPSLFRTLELYRAGGDIPKIAAERGLSEATITQHIAELVLASEIDDVSAWVDDSMLKRIRQAANGGPIGALGPLKEALGDAVTYDQLHLARAFLNRDR